ncbi:hypothetical protein [Streptomyces sp. enrichment culture]|uniref:hypothetical protein n=1 Tax=Streptomyces sp. enrichment culture TaxID=1795815 RepID=UPI003F55BE5E
MVPWLGEVALALWAAGAAWPVVGRQQGVVLEDELVPALWGVREPVRLAAVALVLAAVELSLSPAAVW